MAIPNAQAVGVPLIPPSAAGRSGLRRVVFASSLGSAIEQYDFFCYAFIAPIAFSEAFFPKLDQLTGTLAVYATFGVGFVARPVGGVVFGHYGDRVGRKTVLMLTLLLMGIASFLIGCLPSYASIGLWAPLLLVTCRFLQGLAFGGEYMSAVTLTLENAPTARRGFFASWINASGPMGVISAAGIIALLSALLGTAAFRDWGWRVPFLLSFLLVAIGTYVRSHVDESVLFKAAQAERRIPRMPVAAVLKSWKASTLLAVLINIAQSSFQYMITVFALGYAVRKLGISAASFTSGTTAANVVEMLLIPVIAMCSDRFGRRGILLAGIAVAAVSFPLFLHILALQNVGLLILGLVIAIGLGHALMFAPEAAFSAELFPIEVRVTGSSLGKQLGVVLGGGCAPFIATALMGEGSDFTSVIAYFEAMAVLAFIGIIFAPDTRKRVL
jgi:MHS family shikimate/dehydroshikimate transporter-like MFS transporter